MFYPEEDKLFISSIFKVRILFPKSASPPPPPSESNGRPLKESYEISMALKAGPEVTLLLQSACTSMYRHIYNWNIVACDIN